LITPGKSNKPESVPHDQRRPERRGFTGYPKNLEGNAAANFNESVEA